MSDPTFVLEEQQHVSPFTPPLSAEELNDHFSDYGDMEILAHGGQEIVIRSHLRNCPEEQLAIKIYFPGSHSERTNREIASLERLNTPNIARLRSSGAITIRGEECPYVISDFIGGLSLEEKIAQGPMNESEVIHVGYGVASAIEEMWKLRIVHRDVKPANIMRRDNGECVLIDLGIARHLSFPSLTTIGKTWGTEGYMSPEHARAMRQLSCKSDIFSLGITLQECLTGKHPTKHNQYALSMGGCRSFSLVNDLSTSLAQIIDSMIEYRPERRPAPAVLIEAFNSLHP